MNSRRSRARITALALMSVAVAGLVGCTDEFEEPKADLILENARVYTLTWDDPDTDGNTITKVAEITPRTDGDSKMSQMQVVHSGEKAFFVGQDKVYGHEMWVTDGTTEGTHMVLDIGFAEDPDNTNDGATVSTKIENHFAVNDEQVIFRAETPAWWVNLEGTYES